MTREVSHCAVSSQPDRPRAIGSSYLVLLRCCSLLISHYYLTRTCLLNLLLTDRACVQRSLPQQQLPLSSTLNFLVDTRCPSTTSNRPPRSGPEPSQWSSDTHATLSHTALPVHQSTNLVRKPTARMRRSSPANRAMSSPTSSHNYDQEPISAVSPFQPLSSNHDLC